MPDLSSIGEELYVENEYGVRHQNPDARLDEEDVRWLAEHHEIDISLHRTCINCQVRQLIKYKDWQDKDGNHVEGFQVPCKGIPAALPPGSAERIEQMVVSDGIDPERAKLLLKATIDPVAWATLMFGFDESDPTWRLRSYQKEQLRCTSQRIVIREGRRSGKTFVIALKLLFLLFNKLIRKGTNIETGKPIYTGPEILVVTPFQSQLLNVFDNMEKLLKRNRSLSKQVETGTGSSLYVKTPYFRMELSNGGEVNGFVSGVGVREDGSGGGSIRGQDAHIVYLDEMDMIPDEVLEKAVIPILLTDLTGDVTFIGTSTPIGKRGRFFQYCKESPDWKEDHLPSTVLPQWNKIKGLIENDETGTQETFDAEYMALFINGSHGVFKPVLVEQCRKDYTYDKCFDLTFLRDRLGFIAPKDLLICLGIDWNKNAGSEFVVTCFDPHSYRYLVLEAVNIPASKFSAVKWKEEVIRLNFKWRPDWIYADEGYGHTIIEDLLVYAHELRTKKTKTRQDVETIKLIDRLKSFNFSSTIELTSPIDGTPITKRGKEYLIDNTTRILEDGYLSFSELDVVLRKQMLNYVILRRSPLTNKPVYGPENKKIGDHRLDALMLSLAGLQLEAGMYSGHKADITVPTALSKERLDARRRSRGFSSPGQQLLHELETHQPFIGTGALSILQVLREGESVAEAVQRGQRDEPRVQPRRRGRENTSPGPLEYFKNEVPNYSGYADDSYLKYEAAPRVLPRRQRGTRSQRRKKR